MRRGGLAAAGGKAGAGEHQRGIVGAGQQCGESQGIVKQVVRVAHAPVEQRGKVIVKTGEQQRHITQLAGIGIEPLAGLEKGVERAVRHHRHDRENGQRNQQFDQREGLLALEGKS